MPVAKRQANKIVKMKNPEYDNTLFSLKDKVVLITGGYGLLGSQFAKTISKAGGNVVIAGRNLERAEKLALEIDGMAIEVDISKKGSVELSVEKIVKRYGTIHGLVNNASYSSQANNEIEENFTDFENLRESVLERSYDIDIKGMILCCQAVGKVMTERKGGTIINVSSIYGMLSPDPRIYDNIRSSDGRKYVKPVGYCVAKGAIINFTRYLGVYWAEKNIRVNSLSLGGIYDNQDKLFVKAYSERVPLRRMAKPDEYNGAILYMLSDASSYMTGANIVIDGGLSAW